MKSKAPPSSRARPGPDREPAEPAGDDAGSAEKRHQEQVLAVLQKFRLVFKSAQKHFHWVERQCGVSGAQLWALWELCETPGLRVSELARVMSIHQSTASNLLDKLEQRKLIRRERKGPDQRVVRLFATPAGLAVVSRAPRPARGVLPDALSQLPESDLRALDASLNALVNLMRIRDEKAAMMPLSEI